MTLALTRVTFHGLAHSDSLESFIQERAAWLEQFYAGIRACRVVVELPHRHRHDGRHFHVRVEIVVPGAEPIVVDHEPSLHAPERDVEQTAHRKRDEVDGLHQHAQAAVHEAFDAARRRLQDTVREQRHAVKTHASAADLS